MAKRGRPRHPDILTPREWEVLALLREGLSNEQIAERLGITERTARYHVSEILGKLGVSTRQEAAAWQPEERRPWWALAIGPLALWRRGWAGAAAAAVAILVVGAGLGFLLWGMARTHGGSRQLAASATPTKEQASTASVSGLNVGQSHACALVDGAVFCWGQSYDYSALRVPGLLGPVRSLAAGNDYSCALLSAGTVRCWGENRLGQLGNGGASNVSVPPDQPSEVAGLTDVVAISAGANHTCALSSSGGVKCWGDNTYGQLGDGTTTQRDRPVDVIGLDNGVRAIAVGGNFTCVLTKEAAVECWGSNAEGQLAAATDASCGAPGFVFDCNTQPRAVEGLSANVAAIAASAEGQHACAITTEQQLECWGTNAVGQLGIQTTETCSSPTSPCAMTPTAVPGVGHITVVALGMYHTCAAEAEGEVKCWGDNLFGQLGDGTTTRRFSPVAVKNISEVSALGAGWLNTCALTSSKQVLCWGADKATGTGVPSEESCGCSTAPVAVYGLSPQEDSTPEPADQLAWYRVGDKTVAASTSPVCGDRATASEYDVPRMLTVDSGHVRLGLEAQPYPYVAAQVSSPLGQGRKPVGWELTERQPLYLGVTSVPQGVWIGPTELFLRRLNSPDQLFRYTIDLCKQDSDFHPFPIQDLNPDVVLKLPTQLPRVIEHLGGDYISAQEAIDAASKKERQKDTQAGLPQSAIDDVRTVWAELGTAKDFPSGSYVQGNTPTDPVWLVVLSIGDLAGPLRPGHPGLARYYVLDPKTGFIEVEGGCCFGLTYSR